MAEHRKRELRPFLPLERDLRDFEWSLEKKAYGLLWVLLPFCPFWWWIDKREPDSLSDAEKREWNQRRANWVLAWLIVLIALWLANPDSQPWKTIVGVLAALRLLEIFVTGLGTILDQTQQIRARNVVTIAIYAIQVMFIFAILYHSFAADAFEPDPTSASDYLYISWSAMVSLGNQTFKPTGDSARFLEVANTTASIFLLTVLFAYAIDALKTGRKDGGQASREIGDDACGTDACEANPGEPSPKPALLLEYKSKSGRLRATLRRRRRR